MHLTDIPFGVTDWASLPATRHPGETGEALWRTQQFGGGLRVRMVTYSPGYLADHWCQKGHILLVLDGTLHTTLEDGRTFSMSGGMSYQVADGAEAHRSSAPDGARLFIVD
jgi:quercetin dioxygenase-like cupin family protein